MCIYLKGVSVLLFTVDLALATKLLVARVRADRVSYRVLKSPEVRVIPEGAEETAFRLTVPGT